MRIFILVLLSIAILGAGCAAKAPGPEGASGQAGAPGGGEKNDSGAGPSMEVSEGGKTVTFGDGEGGAGDATDESTVVAGGTLGMEKEEQENTTVAGSDGGQIVDVGGSIPVR